MICRITESFELTAIENKILNDFQELLMQMKENCSKIETQRTIENIYYNTLTLIAKKNDE